MSSMSLPAPAWTRSLVQRTECCFVDLSRQMLSDVSSWLSPASAIPKTLFWNSREMGDPSEDHPVYGMARSTDRTRSSQEHAFIEKVWSWVKLEV